MRALNTSCDRSLATIIAIFCLLPTVLLAQTSPSSAKPPAQPAKKSADDKVDISDLENKYWAPKDTDFSVVQNRTYTKDGRWFATLQMGRPVNDPYSEGTVYGLTGNYFWSERMGVQATYLRASLQNNEATDDLKGFGNGVQPDHGKFSKYYGVGLNIVPFYAKMSFWGKRIIYFDMVFTPTIGVTGYDQIVNRGNESSTALTYGMDVSQYFFFTNYFAVRMDLKNQWHKEDILKYNGTGEGTKISDKMVHDTLFLLGLSFFY